MFIVVGRSNLEERYRHDVDFSLRSSIESRRDRKHISPSMVWLVNHLKIQCVCVCVTVKKKGGDCFVLLLCPFLGDMEFMLYLLLPYMIYNFPSPPCCKKHLGAFEIQKRASGRDECWRWRWGGGRANILNDPLSLSPRLHGGGSDPQRVSSHRDQGARHVKELYR